MPGYSLASSNLSTTSVSYSSGLSVATLEAASTGSTLARQNKAASGGGLSGGEFAVSPAVAAAVAAAGDDSESDLEQPQHQSSGNRSRQKKFFKNFKQLPQEEVVLQSKLSRIFILQRVSSELRAYGSRPFDETYS